jgi:Ser/Thr protein kinase RdoA (MazF antagonist)
MEEIAKILESYPVDCRPTTIRPLGSAGGLSGARFWQIVAPRGTLVLRCWPNDHPSPGTLEFIHAVLRHAAARGLTFLPAPIATSGGDTFLRYAGRLWELAPWLPGVADYASTPSPARLAAAMAMLAEFHIAVAGFPGGETWLPACGVAPAISHRLKRLRELQCGGFDSLANRINVRVLPELAPLAREFVRQLPHALPKAAANLAPLADLHFALQPCIRDVWHENILFDGDSVTGIVDFGAMQIDTPATDVARLLGSLVGDSADGWRDGLAAYDTIRPISPDERRAVAALDEAGAILALANWLRWIYVEGRQFDDERKVVDRFRQNLLRLERYADSP